MEGVLIGEGGVMGKKMREDMKYLFDKHVLPSSANILRAESR